MKIITSIEKKGKAYIYNRMEMIIYIFKATTQTIRIKETRCAKITTHDYYKYIVLLTIVPIVLRTIYYKRNLHNKQNVVFHCSVSMWELTDAWTQKQNCIL